MTDKIKTAVFTVTATGDQFIVPGLAYSEEKDAEVFVQAVANVASEIGKVAGDKINAVPEIVEVEDGATQVVEVFAFMFDDRIEYSPFKRANGVDGIPTIHVSLLAGPQYTSMIERNTKLGNAFMALSDTVSKMEQNAPLLMQTVKMEYIDVRATETGDVVEVSQFYVPHLSYPVNVDIKDYTAEQMEECLKMAADDVQRATGAKFIGFETIDYGNIVHVLCPIYLEGPNTTQEIAAVVVSGPLFDQATANGDSVNAAN